MRWPTYERMADQHELLEVIGLTAGLPGRLGMIGADAVEARAAYREWRLGRRKGRR
jgi:hypothetical protein